MRDRVVVGAASLGGLPLSAASSVVHSVRTLREALVSSPWLISLKSNLSLILLVESLLNILFDDFVKHWVRASLSDPGTLSEEASGDHGSSQRTRPKQSVHLLKVTKLRVSLACGVPLTSLGLHPTVSFDLREGFAQESLGKRADQTGNWLLLKPGNGKLISPLLES